MRVRTSLKGTAKPVHIAVCEVCGVRATIACDIHPRAQWHFCDAHYAQHMKSGHRIITTAESERQRRREQRKERKLAWLERKARKWFGLPVA